MDDFECEIHQLWYKFGNYLRKWYYELHPGYKLEKGKVVQSKRKYKELKLEKVVGYIALGRMDRFCRENPDMRRVDCDDSFHTSSTLYMVPHKSEEEYWGTSILYIPQNGDKNNFFLYPEHLKNLLKVLTELDIEYENLKNRRKNEKE